MIYLKWCRRRRRRISQKPMLKQKKPSATPKLLTFKFFHMDITQKLVGCDNCTFAWRSKSEWKKSKQLKALNTTNDNQHRQMFMGEHTQSSNRQCDWWISHRTKSYSLWLRQMLRVFFQIFVRTISPILVINSFLPWLCAYLRSWHFDRVRQLHIFRTRATQQNVPNRHNANRNKRKQESSFAVQIIEIHVYIFSVVVFYAQI